MARKKWSEVRDAHLRDDPAARARYAAARAELERELAACELADDIIATHADVHTLAVAAEVTPAAVLATLRRHGWVWVGHCDATTDALAYTGTAGELACTKPAEHIGTHVSAEGARW